MSAVKLPKCGHCDNEFLPRHAKQVYCSDRCRQAAFQEKQKAKVKGGGAPSKVSSQLGA